METMGCAAKTWPHRLLDLFSDYLALFICGEHLLAIIDGAWPTAAMQRSPTAAILVAINGFELQYRVNMEYLYRLAPRLMGESDYDARPKPIIISSGKMISGDD